MKKIILFNPRAAEYAKIIPNAILQIAASIENKFEYVVVDGNREPDPLTTIKQYLESGEFGYFCLTVMPGPQTRQAIPFSREVRKSYPQVKIIWGGYFASNQHDVVARSGYVDWVVNGPGDHAFPSLLKALENNSPYDQIENLVFERNGEITRTPKGALTDQDQLPDLPYDTLNRFYSIEGYLGKTFLGTRTAAYHSSIGCPFTCSFCGVVPIFEAGWKGKSAERVTRDLKFLRNKYGINAFNFHDNNFFVSEKRSVEFAKLIKNENMNWWAEGRIDTMDKYSDESLQRIADSGCRMIFFGAESGNDALLKKMDKGGSQSGEKIRAFACRIRKFGIVPEYSFVLGFPAPTEREVWDQIDADIRFIKEIKSINSDTEVIIYIYSPVPTEGSELFRQALREGFSYPKHLDDWLDPQWLTFDHHRNPLTPWLKPAMVRKIHEFETIVNARYPTLTDYKLTGLQRRMMKALSGLRYKLNVFALPYELKVLQKYWLKYRRPEIEGL